MFNSCIFSIVKVANAKNEINAKLKILVKIFMIEFFQIVLYDKYAIYSFNYLGKKHPFLIITNKLF